MPDASRIDRLEILRDQEPIPAASWNRALPIDGGSYAITARALGRNDWSTRVTIGSTLESKTVDIPVLERLPQTLSEHPKPPESSHATMRRGSLAPIAVGAGAVALLGGALGFSLWGDSTYDKAKAEMMDQARRDSLYDSANHKRYAAEGLAVAGVGCTGVAVWLYLRHRGAPAETTSARAGRPMLAPAASAEGIGVVGRF